jgi:CBS domain-containing protein
VEKMPVLVKDIMSKPVLKVDSEEVVEVAGKLMAKARSNSIVVISSGNPVGLLTDSDLIKKVVARNIKPSTIRVREVMSRPLVMITPEDTVLEASRKMRRNNLKRLPVISDGKLVGLISTTDIAKTIPEMEDMLEWKMKTKELPMEIKENETSGICDACGNYSEELRMKNAQWMCEDCREEIESE